MRNYTIFAPTDAAIQSAYDSGSFNYPELFAKDKDNLAGIIAFQAVPQMAYVQPGRTTSNMQTLLSQGHGNVSCANPVLSWRPDGFVYSSSGAAKVSGTYDHGCAAVIFQVDALLQPCCRPLSLVVDGIKAPKGSMTEKALSVLKSSMKVRGTKISLPRLLGF